MHNILTLVHDDDGLDSRLDMALYLTRHFKSQLICLDLTIPVVPMAVEPFYGAMLMEPETRGDVQFAAKRKVEQSGIPYHWVERQGELNREISELSRLSDLIVMSSPRDLPFPDMRSAIGHLLVKGHKRVMAVPRCATKVSTTGDVMLLWDGSETANSALFAATPLLRSASRVTIVEVDDGALGTSAIKAADYLTERRIPNEIRPILRLEERTSTYILEEIEKGQPSYVVMGGYGHSRLVEGIFGGVTERLLHESRVPLFLAN